MRIGISGHQNIGPDVSVKWVRSILRQELINYNATVGISSLAIGADQIFAEVTLELRIELEAIIPSAQYETTFDSNEKLARFSQLIRDSTRQYHLDFKKPTEEAFLAAGKWIVDTCHMMFFVWNGKPAAGLGGTADVVAYAAEKAIPYLHLNPVDQTMTKQNI